MRICDFLTQDRILTTLATRSKEEVIATLAALVAESHPAIDRLTLDRAICEREQQGSTAVGEGVALPHARFPGLGQNLAAFICIGDGIDFESIDGKPTHFIFLLVSPAEAPGPHLKVLARMSRLLSDPGFKARSLQAKSSAEILAIFRDEDDRFAQQLRAA